MSQHSEEQSKLFRDVAEFGVSRINGLFEVIEAGNTNNAVARLFVVTTATTIYLARFAMGSRHVSVRPIADPAKLAKETERQTELRDAKVELFASCGMAAVTTVGGVIAGAPTGGATWVLLLGRGLVAWTECGLKVNAYFSLKEGNRPWVESSGDKVVNLMVKAGDVVFVTTDLYKSAASAMGKKAILGIADDMASGYAAVKLVVQAGELALKTGNLIRAGKELCNEMELVAEMAKHVLGEVTREVNKRLKIPVYGNWCGPRHGSGEPIDLVDRGCMVHDGCYGRRGYFDCECDRELIRTLESIPPERLSERGQIARWSIRNWFDHVQMCRNR